MRLYAKDNYIYALGKPSLKAILGAFLELRSYHLEKNNKIDNYFVGFLQF